MTRRFYRFYAQCLLLLACLLPQVVSADGIEVKRYFVEAAEDGYRIGATYGFELTHGMEDALQYGVPLYFTNTVEFTRPRWYWTDEKAIVQRRTYRLSYNVLIRQYYVTVVGGVQQSFSTLEDALFVIRRPTRWLVAPRGALKVGEVYNVTLRMSLDPDYLPKPFQVNAFNNSDWRLSSDKKSFQYKAE
ncbi:DUF4390 domain-containing protein [Oxalobacteraceae bacterium A2-2]